MVTFFKLKTVNQWLILPFVIITVSCGKPFYKQAHRGGRGLMPENTIPAMRNALDMGIDLEMDLYLTADRQIVVSHEDHIWSVIALDAGGKPVTTADEKNLVLTKMPYAEIGAYDVGSKFNPAFPQKKSVKTSIPLFSNLVDSVEAYVQLHHYKLPIYNIEAKLPKKGNFDQGYREAFYKVLVPILKQKDIEKRIILQSFDPEFLEIVKRDYPELKNAFLVSKGTVTENLKQLTFVPDYYSPEYKTITKQTIVESHKKGMKVIAWTVNTKAEIDTLKKLGTDGVISDYPNLFKDVK